MSRILIIEDEAIIRAALNRLLSRHGHQVDEAESIEAGLPFDPYDLIISDLRLPGKPGTEVLNLAPGVPVIIMTSYASITSAVEAMKMGATDYIAKPFDHDELLRMIEKVLQNKLQQGRANALQEDAAQTFPITGIVGNSHLMQGVFNRIQKVAPTEATVLIQGESGTGKELVARALHQNSERANAPFIAFNCAAVPEQAIENDLFGQGYNSGLMQQAGGGTLFLDEIGELPLATQARLLRILQQDEPVDPLYSVRILAATHQDMRALVQEDKFRSDLYFRLRVVEINLPPLRERADDVIQLAMYLLERSRSQLGYPPLQLSRETLQAIRRYRWPGNVRELANAIERAVILCEDNVITPDLLAIDHNVSKPNANKAVDIDGKLSLEEYFRVFVLQNQQQMSETELAQALGISRKTLWERRQRFGIPRNKNATA